MGQVAIAVVSLAFAIGTWWLIARLMYLQVMETHPSKRYARKMLALHGDLELYRFAVDDMHERQCDASLWRCVELIKRREAWVHQLQDVLSDEEE